MTRLAVIALLVTGCTVGEEQPRDEGVDGASRPDAPTVTCGPPVDARAVRTTAAAAHLHSDDNTTKTGQSCIVAGCHALGGIAPGFTFAGTLYREGGIEPAPGVEVRAIPDDGGPPIKMRTDAAGNFRSSQVFPGPSTLVASGCPAPDQQMAAKVTTPVTGGCNGGTACHQMPGGLPLVMPDF